MIVVAWLCRNSLPTRVDRYFRKLQLVSAGLYSLGHGGNDAQKTMGIIAILAVQLRGPSGARPTDIHVTLWMVLSCHAAIALGTLSGGWRIVKTMGSKITKLKPVGGFCAETAAALTLFANSLPWHPRLDHAHHHGRDHGRRGACSGYRPCAGASPPVSSGHGSLRFHARPW